MNNNIRYPDYSRLIQMACIEGERALKKWQLILNLDNWNIELYIDTENELWENGELVGHIEIIKRNQFAILTLTNPHHILDMIDPEELKDIEKVNKVIIKANEGVIIHELIHLWLSHACDGKYHSEEYIDDLVMALMDLDKNRNPLVPYKKETTKED